MPTSFFENFVAKQQVFCVNFAFLAEAFHANFHFLLEVANVGRYQVAPVTFLREASKVVDTIMWGWSFAKISFE